MEDAKNKKNFILSFRKNSSIAYKSSAQSLINCWKLLSKTGFVGTNNIFLSLLDEFHHQMLIVWRLEQFSATQQSEQKQTRRIHRCCDLFVLYHYTNKRVRFNLLFLSFICVFLTCEHTPTHTKKSHLR